MRRILTLALVAFWVVMLARLVAKQATPPPAASHALPAGSIAERDEWFSVHREGKQVGHAHRVTARTSRGQLFSEDMVVALAMLGEPQTVRTSLVAETDASFALRRFHFALASPAATFSASGTSDGRQLAVTYGPVGQTQEMTVPLREPIYLPSTLRPRVLAGDRTPGTSYTVPVFNPLTLQNEPMTVTIEGTETMASPDGPIEALRLAEAHHGMQARVWLAENGAVVREEGSLGFTLERASRSQALADVGSLIPVDLVTTSRIPFDRRIDEPRAATQLTLRLRGAAAASVPDDPPRQRVSGDRLRIAREALPAGVPLRTRPNGAQEAALAVYTAPAPFIESGDPAIVAAARAAVGSERDATAAARTLVLWVGEHLEQTPRMTVPSAREVLASRRGDCNEHAVLLAALARAAGIPSRVVAGVMYLEDGFYYHAWNELWLGAWISADATLGQLPADATHVKLIEGGPERHLALAEMVGRLTFASEEVSR